MSKTTKWGHYLDKAAGEGKKVIPGFNMVKPHTSNLYTGLELSKGIAVAAGVGALAWGIGSSYARSEFDRGPEAARKNVEDVGYLPGMSGDAVGNVSSGRRDLGATGDLVFGMHNARKG